MQILRLHPERALLARPRSHTNGLRTLRLPVAADFQDGDGKALAGSVAVLNDVTLHRLADLYRGHGWASFSACSIAARRLASLRSSFSMMDGQAGPFLPAFALMIAVCTISRASLQAFSNPSVVSSLYRLW